jgi:protoporphyrinogen oxidase
MKPVVVFGSGMAACGAAHRLQAEGVPHLLFDKGDHPGGHTKTYQYPGGWVFDDGPHVSFTDDERIKAILAENVDHDFHTGPTSVDNYWHGHWVKHPAQVNLHGLPTDLVVGCINDFVEAAKSEPPEPRNYEEWLLASYGRTFALNFPFLYTRKIHCTEPANLTTDWIGPRLYRPDLEEVLRGALAPATPDVHYIEGFRYPTHGGFFAYLAPILARSELSMGHEVVSIRPGAREVEFSNGRVVEYSSVVSSIPLPDLVPLVEGASDSVLEAASALHYTGCVFVNIGVGRVLELEATWTYIYDEDIAATRLSFPHIFSPGTVPDGCSSIQAEVYFSPHYKPLVDPPQAIADRVVADLHRMGILHRDDDLRLVEAVVSPYANAIFDHDRASALEVVREFLTERSIATAGRFGDWEYLWTDASFRSGERAASEGLGS